MQQSTPLACGRRVQIRLLLGSTGPDEEDLALLGRYGHIVRVATYPDAAPLYAVQMEDWPTYPPLAFRAQELSVCRHPEGGSTRRPLGDGSP